MFDVEYKKNMNDLIFKTQQRINDVDYHSFMNRINSLTLGSNKPVIPKIRNQMKNILPLNHKSKPSLIKYLELQKQKLSDDKLPQFSSVQQSQNQNLDDFSKQIQKSQYLKFSKQNPNNLIQLDLQKKNLEDFSDSFQKRPKINYNREDPSQNYSKYLELQKQILEQPNDSLKQYHQSLNNEFYEPEQSDFFQTDVDKYLPNYLKNRQQSMPNLQYQQQLNSQQSLQQSQHYDLQSQKHQQNQKQYQQYQQNCQQKQQQSQYQQQSDIDQIQQRQIQQQQLQQFVIKQNQFLENILRQYHDKNSKIEKKTYKEDKEKIKTLEFEQMLNKLEKKQDQQMMKFQSELQQQLYEFKNMNLNNDASNNMYEKMQLRLLNQKQQSVAPFTLPPIDYSSLMINPLFQKNNQTQFDKINYDQVLDKIFPK